jgi:hypothetical protein
VQVVSEVLGIDDATVYRYWETYRLQFREGVMDFFENSHRWETA